MGAIRGVVENLDASSGSLEEQKQIVETLARLAEAKAEFFELQISTSLRTAGSEDNKTVPVEAVLASITETHAYSEKSSGAIGETVGKALNSFCDGSKADILTGVGSLISDSLTIFLGDGSASNTTKRKSYVLTEGYSVIRVDVLAWKLNVESKGISSRAERVCAIVAVKSAVDLNKMGFNTFLSVYSKQLQSMKLDEGPLKAALKEARDIYDQFHSSAAVTHAAEDVTSLPG